MANRTKATTNNHDQVTTSTSKSRSKQQSNNLTTQQLQNERIQDKKDLQNLNDRLASLFHMKKEFENEALNLKEQLNLTKEAYETKIEETKIFYEEQLSILREKLDQECTNSAKKVIDYEKFKNLAKELEKENSKLVNDLNQYEKRNNLLTNEVDKIKAKLNQVSEDFDQARKLIQTLESERNALDKTAKRNLAQAEAEKLRSISLEGKLKALDDKMQSEKHFYLKEIEEIKLRAEEEKEDEIEEIVQNEVELIRTELMIKSKRDLEENACKIRLDLEQQHKDELNRLKESLSSAISAEKTAKSRLNSNLNYIEKLNAKINEFSRIESSLNNRIAELEGLLEVEKSEKLDLLDEKDREIKELEDELKSKDSENQFVLDTNVQLKEEIQIYRSLLEEQEKSLEGNDLNTSGNSNQKATRSSGTPTTRRYAQAVRKRKRNVIDHVNETTIINKSIGPIAIDESTDQFIRLVNRTDEAIPLGGWELNRQRDDEGYTFKFYKSIVVQPNEMITIYSADAENAVHNPPVAIKMKKNWPAGGITTLYNPNREEIAKWEYSLSSKRSRYNGAAGDEGDKSCCIM